MLTQKAIQTVQVLNKRKENVSAIIRNFSSPYVKASIGLVNINSASPNVTDKCDNADIFHWELEHIESELNEKALELLKAELMHIKAELTKYIIEE